VVALIAVVGGVIAYGTAKWQRDPYYYRVYGSVMAPAPHAIVVHMPVDQPIGLALRP
jgi:hypothetical protein